MPRSPEISHEENDLNESFQEYFSEGTLIEIAPSEYDDDIVDALGSFQDEVDYVQHEEISFSPTHVYRIDHDNGDSTYAACYERKTKTWDVICILDTRDGKKIGIGWIDHENMPVVGWTETTEDVRGQGIGIRRLREMNALAQAIYKKPLHSGEPLEVEAEKLWKNLVRNQEADKEIIDGIPKYFFR